MANQTISISEITNIELDGVDRRDYPDFCDAFISYAEWKETGEPLTDDELERVEGVGELALESVIQGDYN